MSLEESDVLMELAATTLNIIIILNENMKRLKRDIDRLKQSIPELPEVDSDAETVDMNKVECSQE